MNGLSPRPYTLTPAQQKTSAKITEEIPEMPTTLADLISQMATPDFELAARQLELDKDGAMMQNQKNQSIIAMIEFALSSPSSECAPWIKSRIFANATGNMHGKGVIQPYLVEIINRLPRAGEQINLDDVLLEDMHLRKEDGLDLSGMSAQRATFYNMHLFQINMTHANFTGARFVNTTFLEADISKANITDATFELSKIHGTAANELVGNQTAIFDCRQTYPDRVMVDNVPTYVGNIYLNFESDIARPDRSTYTLFPDELFRSHKNHEQS